MLFMISDCCVEISILVEDLMPKFAKKIVLREFQEKLTAIGVRKENISIFISLGTHQPLSTSAMAKSGRLDFIINSVLDHNDRLHDTVCGDPFQAHRAGAGLCKKITAKSFPSKSYVTIISAFPHTEGPQIMNPLASTDMINPKGGTVILYTDCDASAPETYDDFIPGPGAFFVMDRGYLDFERESF